MIKKLARLLIILVLALLTLYLIFLSIVSVSVGFVNSERAGFWMPILFGLLIFCIDLYMIKLIVYLLKQTKGRVKIRNYKDTVEKQRKKRGLRKSSYACHTTAQCYHCCEKKAENQVAVRFGRKGGKVVPVHYSWICDDCIVELKTAQKTIRE